MRREDELAPLCRTSCGDAQARDMPGFRPQTVLSYVWPLPGQSRGGPSLCPVHSSTSLRAGVLRQVGVTKRHGLRVRGGEVARGARAAGGEPPWGRPGAQGTATSLSPESRAAALGVGRVEAHFSSG